MAVVWRGEVGCVCGRDRSYSYISHCFKQVSAPSYLIFIIHRVQVDMLS